ncbi:hypothetical protein Clacol_009806 [Clathrus columnatus]|uniref:Chorismate mutase n=1 Tax=Clathrus columnatus TaxID=1419009 RepID=A0AAV5APU0_9AGAM|nr:hypothetical protein Clacol_009806 [Clathrus columnatus]
MSINFFLAENPLDLNNIRSVLTRLEDTIIFGCIERAQFAYNPKIYQAGAFQELEELGFHGSLLEWFLKETEAFHGRSSANVNLLIQRFFNASAAKARRYTSPDEYPFSKDLPDPVLKPLDFPKILHPNTVNANDEIFKFYINEIVPKITKRTTERIAAEKQAKGLDTDYDHDGNYGSSATLDVEILQAISKRIHYGAFVAETKFVEKPSAFIPHIQNPNPDALDALITKPAVEKALLERLKKKVAFYGQDLGANGQPVENPSLRIDPEDIYTLYHDHIIRVTKDVEVEYLMQRLNGYSQEEIEEMLKN